MSVRSEQIRKRRAGEAKRRAMKAAANKHTPGTTRGSAADRLAAKRDGKSAAASRKKAAAPAKSTGRIGLGIMDTPISTQVKEADKKMSAIPGKKKTTPKKVAAKKAAPKKGGVTGKGGKTVSKGGKKLANVTREQLKKSGLSLRAYMNKWNKTGTRPA